MGPLSFPMAERKVRGGKAGVGGGCVGRVVEVKEVWVPEEA
jgi:hypothetical protein